MTGGLNTVYELGSAEEAEAFYDNWADGYETELDTAGYVTPNRCATALASFVSDLTEPVLELGCGTGLGGVALKKVGFTTIDGTDLSSEMLGRARTKGIYRNLEIADLSTSLDQLAGRDYAHIAAIGVFNPNFMPPTALDEILALLPTGGRFVFSLNDHTLAERSFPLHVFELIECRAANLLFKEHGPHLPGTGLESTVYVLEAC
ncbi:MAG: methyltransferase domain-containing protein [Pseudomonadota bacterium]